MRRFFASLGLALTLTLTTALGAGPLHIDGQTVDAAATVRNNTTYVSLRAVVETLRPDAAVFWSDGQAAAEDSGLSLTARPGNLYLEVNGRALYIPQGCCWRTAAPWCRSGCWLTPWEPLWTGTAPPAR